MTSKSSYNIYDTTREAWRAMYRAIEYATKSIYWEVYILVDEGTGLDFFELLKKKVTDGVDVKLILDYWGSFALSSKKVDELKKAGIDIRLFRHARNPFKGFHQWLTRRTHRKVLIVDERIGFVGGVNVFKASKNWKDIHIMFKGKVVRSLLRSFAKTYVMCGGEKADIRHLFQYTYRVEHDSLDFVYDDTGRKYSRMRKKYIDALYKARERVVLFSPYYLPDKEILKAMWSARKRGVKIDMLIPLRADLVIAKYAAYAFFSLLHKRGIKIHLAKKMMHGKGIIVDGKWAMVGSSNMEPASLYHNQETNVHMSDKRLVKKITRILERWIHDAKPFDSIAWEKRGRWHKLKERIATKMYKFWFGLK
ncbi:MAG TPA: hypothetical protein DCS29_00585 [Candidatus Magasanikbacteria bacterium]|nr:hypothetical protein [Candidatus Magasanikbacteria bacterium]